MGPKEKLPTSGQLFQQPLTDFINGEHELVVLSGLINWDTFEKEWSSFFPSTTGRPAKSPRLIAGILYLQRKFVLSDEAVIAAWLENPYWQYFCGEIYFQDYPPMESSSLTRWRKRIGEVGVERLLAQTIETAKRVQAAESAR